MKFKIITVTFILIIGTNCFSDDIFLSGGFGVSPQVQLTSFSGTGLKPQPKINADAAFFINFYDTVSAGLSVAYIYNRSSSVDGGWSYPGFSGLETGLEILYHLPFYSDLGIGGTASAGWYRYNLTTNIFFLPSCTLYPSWRFLNTRESEVYLEFPATVYFHNEADLFMSAGIRMRMVLK